MRNATNNQPKADANKVRVFWMNHGWFSDEEFDDLPAAVRYAQSKGPSATFHQGTTMLGSWDVIAGYRSRCPAGDAGYSRW
ncbi:MAG: hypothetical protein KIT09_31750 [Bryobacteraceae bacterium]|nr:hypothetical protein [Bryobacteraceae bacterium]